MKELDTNDLHKLKEFPHLTLGNWPTVIEEGTLPCGTPLLVKRDDTCGHGRGGAKARKIEHLLGYMKKQGYDTFIGVAGNVTNVIFDILPVLEEQEIAHHLYIIDEPRMKKQDRDLVFEGVKEQVHFVGPHWVPLAIKVYAKALELRLKGRKPFVVLPGLSHPSAIVGNACGFLEMVQQRKDQGLEPPKTVYITAATGSTIAGFLIAENAWRAAGNPPVRIVGVQVFPGSIPFLTKRLMRWTERKVGLRSRVPFSHLDVDKSQIYGGFGHFPEHVASLCNRVSRDYQVDVDPIFGGKTWASMEAACRDKKVEGPVLFWHCGYTPEWEMLGVKVQDGLGKKEASRA